MKTARNIWSMVLVAICLYAQSDAQVAETPPQKSESATVAEKMILLSNAFDEADVEGPHALILLQFVGRHSLERLTTISNRIPKIGVAVRTNWKAAFEAATNDSVDITNTLILIAQIDPMWKATELLADREGLYLNRLKTIPSEETKRWAKFADKEGAASAADLVVVDVLFQDGKFVSGALTKHIEEQTDPKGL